MPRTETLRYSDPSVLQPCFADNSALQRPASRIAEFFHLLCCHGLSMGYFTEQEKCWVICPLSFEPHACQIFHDASIPVNYCHGRWYVSGFVGSRVTRDEWLSPMIQKWVTRIKRPAAIATRFPHSAYTSLVSYLSAEWQYICQMLPDVGPSLVPVENALHTKFLPAILGIAGPIDDKLRTFLSNGVKTGGMAIQNPTLAAASLYSTAMEATEMLAGTLIRNEQINIKVHRSCVHAAGVSHRITRCNSKVTYHTTLMEWLLPRVKKRMERATTAGAWLSTIPDRFSGTELTKDEWLDNDAIRYGQHPANLPGQCNGCGTGLMLEHGLSCKSGRLVSIHHDDVRDEWAHLCGIALTDLRVVIKPTPLYGNGLQADTRNTTPTTPSTANPTNALGDEACGNVRAHSFWNCGLETVVDVCICDTDLCSYGTTSLNKIIEHHTKEKKDK
ncbi:hypothetical protein ACHAW6_014342 [Cyclotella cf. meneghiniana]